MLAAWSGLTRTSHLVRASRGASEALGITSVPRLHQFAPSQGVLGIRMQRCDDVLHDLEAVPSDRLQDRPEGSYTASLFADHERLERKIMEEAFEVCLELGRPPPEVDRMVAEAADLFFHLLVGLVSVGANLDAVLAELKRRRQ